jgi:hypothetical protein
MSKNITYMYVCNGAKRWINFGFKRFSNVLCEPIHGRWKEDEARKCYDM